MSDRRGATTEQLAPGKLTVSPEEAAGMLSVSRDFFDEHIAHELRIIRRGRRKLIPVRELEHWVAREAAPTLGERG